MEPVQILIVEDETVLRRAISAYYQDQGAFVTEAGTVAAARIELETSQFDAVLLDVSLPDGNGLALLDQVPVERAIAITSTPDTRLFQNLGIGHLPKPFDFAALTQAIERIVAA